MLDWRTRQDRPSAEDAAILTRQLLGAAVERRLVADVPLGAFLSGGIDSTVIVGLMRERASGPLRTFSLGFADDPTYDETAYARVAAKRFGTEHTEFTVEAHAVELVDELVEAYDEPFGDSSAIPTYIVSRLTREHVTVALTGDGGDEMFCGYPRFLGMAFAQGVGHPLASLGRAAGRLLPHHPNFRHPFRRFQRFFAAAALSPEERMLRWIGYLPEVEAYLRTEAVGVSDRAKLTESFRAPWMRWGGENAVARAMALTFETYLPDDLLVKADRCSMAHGLELRSPFLDTALMEFAAGLPDRLRHRGRRLKWLLRRAFADLLPPQIALRGKWGFGVPLPVWFRTHWRPLFEARVLAPDARLYRWLQREPVEALWREHLSATVDHGHALWALLTLETWLRARR
jgi:asparagine synthase (glutamine-hydrolysing)